MRKQAKVYCHKWIQKQTYSIKKGIGIAMISPIFSQRDPYRYASDNTEIFEDYFIRTFQQDGHERIFLPIAWSSYYRRAAYGKDQSMLLSLQKQLNALDRTKKYFTVITWDDGILNDVSHLDLQVFAACGNRIDFPIPLLCQPHHHRFHVTGRDIACSFVGSISHPIRNHIVNSLTGKKGYYISTRPHSMEQYCSILARSKYVLCPRGYGITSFRICEAVQYGCIPIYISDRFGYWNKTLPVDTSNDGWMEYTQGLVSGYQPTIVHREGAYTYDACRQMIIENIKP